MNHKLKGIKLIHGDIITPKITLAEFSEEITREECRKLVLAMNYGHEMLSAYAHGRGNLHIKGVVDLLERLEKIYSEYSYSMHKNQKTEGIN